MGMEPVDATVPVTPGPLGDPMGAPDHDPAVADAVRQLRDQMDEMQRGQEDSNDALREISREMRELRLDDAPPEERDREMDHMRENLTESKPQPSSVGEFGIREPGLTAGQHGRTTTMSQHRMNRLARMAHRRRAQSNENGSQMLPEGTDVTLEEGHWNAEEQEDANTSTPPHVEPPTPASEMENVENGEVPVWLEEASRNVRDIELELVTASRAEPFIVVSDNASGRPIAMITRPASVKPAVWGSQEYSQTIRNVASRRGLAATLARLGAARVGNELAAKLRSFRAQATAGEPAPAAAGPAVPAAPATGGDVLNLADPRVAARIDQIIRADRAAQHRLLRLAWIASARGHVDMPLKGALRAFLGGVMSADPSSIIEDAFLETGEATFDALHHVAQQFAKETPEALAAREHTLLGMSPRRAAPLSNDLRSRAVEASGVPIAAGMGTVSLERDAWDGGAPNLVPELEGTLRMRRLASRQAASLVPRGAFTG